MRSTLLALCLSVLSLGVLGCDDGMKKTDTAPAAPTVSPGPAEPGKSGAMEGPASGKMEAAPATTAPAPVTTTPAPEEPKKEEMPKK